MKIRLSILIPLVLIMSSLVSSAVLFWDEMRVSRHNIEKEGISDVNVSLTHLQNILDTQLAAGDVQDAKLSLAVTALHPGITTLLFADDKDIVMLAHRFLWVGSRAAQVSDYDEEISRQVRRADVSSVSINEQRSLLSGYYPVTLRRGNERSGAGIGVLFVEYDLAPQFASSRREAVVHALTYGSLMITVSVAVALLLHLLVGLRVRKMVAVSERFAAGDLDARVHLRGGDELAELGNAIDRMASQRKQSEEAVISLNQWLHSLLDAASEVSIIATDTQGMITLFNRGSERMLGYSAAELVGKETPMLIHVADEVEYRARQLTAELGYPVTGFKTFVVKPEIAGTEQREWTYVRKNGTQIKVSLAVTTVRSEKGDITGYLGIAQDITERKLAERHLLETSLYTRSLIEASLDPLVTISAEGKITDVNEATEKVTGKNRRRLIGTDFSDYFTEPDKAREGYQKVFLQGSVTDYPLALRHRDGHITDVLYNASVYRDGVGNVLGVFAAARDVTERKRAEGTRAQLAAIVESTNDAIIGKTVDGIITSWNRGAEKIYGYTADEIVGKPITALAPPSRHAEIHEFLGKIRNGETVANYESERIRKDGTLIHVALTLSPISDASGRITGISTIARDITERKHMEEELRQASIYNRSLIEASLDPLVTISAEGKITDVNQATERATGRGRSELIGTDFSDYFTEPDKARVGYQQVFRNGFVTDYLLALRHRDGHVAEVLYNASVYRNEAGEVLGVFAAARDVTERNKAERELAELSLRNRLILDSSGEGIYGLDVDGRCTFANPAAAKLFGFSVEELVGQHSHAMFHHTKADGSPYPAEECPMQAGYKQGLLNRGIDLYWRKDRSSFPVEFVSTPIVEAGEITGAVVMFNDITERKLAEESLLRLNRELRAISNCNETLMRVEDEQALLDRICHIVCDDAGYRMAWVGYPEHDEARTIRPIAWAGVEEGYIEQASLTWRDTERGQGPTGTAIRTGESVSVQDFSSDPQAALWRDAALQRGYRSCISLPLKDENANTFGIFNIYSALPNTFTPDEIRLLEELAGDMAFGINVLRARIERQRAEAEVRRLNQELEQRVTDRTAELETANKELEAFSYSVSHDLRAPLRAIDGFSRILLEDYVDKLDDEGRRLLNVVRDNTSRMAQLIDDILKFSRTGRAEMTVAEIDMEKLARDVFAELQKPWVDSTKLQIEIDRLPGAFGDSALIRQVFVNLLSNAIKFSRNRDPARIKVGFSIEGDEAVYYVKDNGAGFDMQFADKLFGVFQRLHAVTEFEGTGIGLAIVKRIITRHGGRVWAEGKVNEGATIYFSLPRRGEEHA